jgi:hypothetical protein
MLRERKGEVKGAQRMRREMIEACSVVHVVIFTHKNASLQNIPISPS